MNVEQAGFVINPGDFRMQEWLLKAELSAGAKLTYSVLACCAGGRDHAWPSQEFLAEKVSVSVRTLQRYLSELVSFGLIEKCKQYIKGQVRNVYRFLLHSVIGVPEKNQAQDVVLKELSQQLKKPNIVCSEQRDKMSPGSDSIGPPAVAQIEKNLLADTTNCPKRHDKMSSSLNKEETIKGKEDNPPTPQDDLPVAQGGADSDGSGNGGDFSLESEEEENPEWTAVKNRLKSTLTEKDFSTWINPLIFENSASGVILRCPNPFFLNWVKKHFSQQLEDALGDCGLDAWKFDLFTEEQVKKSEQLQEKNCLEKSKVESVTVPTEDVDSLPLEEQFEKFYSTYPRRECRENGWKVFSRLYRTNRLPKTSELIRAVKRAKNENQSWQRENGRYAPQIHRWISERRWMD